MKKKLLLECMLGGCWEGLERARGEYDVKLFQLKIYDLMIPSYPSHKGPHQDTNNNKF